MCPCDFAIIRRTVAKLREQTISAYISKYIVYKQMGIFIYIHTYMCKYVHEYCNDAKVAA